MISPQQLHSCVNMEPLLLPIITFITSSTGVSDVIELKAVFNKSLLPAVLHL